MSSFFPEAYIDNGLILDVKTHEQIPNYEGLCLVTFSGLSSIMFTTLDTKGRNWQFVSWGAVLSSMQITKFMNDRGRYGAN